MHAQFRFVLNMYGPKFPCQSKGQVRPSRRISLTYSYIQNIRNFLDLGEYRENRVSTLCYQHIFCAHPF